jgi:hypothetical protein
MEENKPSNAALSGLQPGRDLATPATLPTRISSDIPSEAALREHEQRNEEHVTRLRRLLMMHAAPPMDK